MRTKLFRLFRFVSIPIATAGILAFLLTRPDGHSIARFSALAQGTPNTSFTQTFTAAGTGTALANNVPTTASQGSLAFRMVYYIQPGSGTVSALSVQLQGSNLPAGSYTALTPAVGGGSGSGSTLNPVTTSPQGQNVLCCDFYPYLEIKVNTMTVTSGSPILIVKVLGYAGTSAAASTGGGGGGGGLACLSGDVTAGSGSCTTATVIGINSVPLCSGFSPTNGQFIQLTTASSPNPCYRALTLGTAAFANLGTSGGTVPLLNGNNTFSGTNNFNNGLTEFWDGTQGLYVGAYTGGVGYGALYLAGTTPGPTNYVFAAGGRTAVNAAAILDLEIGGSAVVIINSLGAVAIGGNTPFANLSVCCSPDATANYGAFSVGGGPFDGATSGFFAGSNLGTTIAVNEASGFGGNLLDLQTAGVSAFSVSAAGVAKLPAQAANVGKPFCVGTGGSIIACTGSTGGTGLTVYSGLAGITLSNATVYFPVGGGSLASSTEASVQTFQGVAGTVSGFGANISAALGTTVATNNVVVLTWRKNGSPTAVTCTITNPATTCSDTTHSFTFAAGDALDIQAVFTGTITATPIWVMNAGVSSGAASAPGSFNLVEEHTASASASLPFTAGITSTYDEYDIEILNLVPVVNGDNLLIQVSTNGGSTYDSGSNYFWDGGSWRAASGFSNGGGTDTSIDLSAANGLGVSSTAASSGANFSLRMVNPLGGTASTQFFGKGFIPFSGSSVRVMIEVGGQYTPTTAVNAFRVTFSTGNIASGTVRLYGLAH